MIMLSSNQEHPKNAIHGQPHHSVPERSKFSYLYTKVAAKKTRDKTRHRQWCEETLASLEQARRKASQYVAVHFLC